MQQLNLDFIQSEELSLKSKSLYEENYYCILKEFIDKNTIDLLKKRYSNKENLLLMESGGDGYHKFYVRYYFKNRKRGRDKILEEVVDKTFTIRNKISLQKNSDQHLLAYLLRYGLDPKRIDEINNHQLSHSFYRIALYLSGQGQKPHLDNPGELQCIIPLTQKGYDYDAGGLVVIINGEEVNLDDKVKPGDLIILNAYKLKHRVEPVKTLNNQIGRLHIFMPIIPDYYFNGGPSAYYFSENKFKLFFTVKMHWHTKIYHHLRHFINIILFRTVPMDDKSYLKP